MASCFLNKIGVLEQQHVVAALPPLDHADGSFIDQQMVVVELLRDVPTRYRYDRPDTQDGPGRLCQFLAQACGTCGEVDYGKR